MKTYRGANEAFVERPFFKPGEIDRICAAELREFSLYPAGPSPIRIDRFVEKRFGIQVSYDDLPDGLLGLTEFGANGVEAIIIARELDSEGTRTAERRIRTTIAHEGGHGLLHTHLLALGAPGRRLFGDAVDPDSSRILCRSGTHTAQKDKRYGGQWWEYQANQAMSALLLPRDLVANALANVLVARGHLGARMLEPERREQAARILADVFDVNGVVARIRLGDLYPDAAERQLTL